MSRNSEDRLEADLARLAAMDLAGLRRRWRTLFGRSAPDGLPRSLLQRAVAYRVQADALGDLDRETVRALERLGRGEGDLPPPQLRGTKPGTLLVREWAGYLHRVMVLEEGFAWNGQTFESLSKVARAITGTNWNGPRFFGLRQKENAKGSQDRRTAS
ncbi:DUF2924 domain-containing protein [Enterovirga sp. CN4-39]|uniref:DUF2924 domain-containing protein n=1 Tax=Enterovirga sp. CN4-39 TaxID=3400910 RepID=UPI003C0B792C